ncbi:MAG: DUF3558 family protein [Thermoanaerobaculia bacterium]|nr:DUF3558 family protein [Thermoanaerobaculia bacterium]
MDHLHQPGRASAAASLCCLLALALAGCSGPSAGESAAAPAPGEPPAAGPPAARDRNACHLLDHAEVSALVEEKIAMRDQTEAEATWSTCEWQTEEGRPAFYLTVTWEGGREAWEVWRTAQGLGNELFRASEGVAPGEVIAQGPVPGLGDAAWFSPLLPSLVLTGDTLFEINLSQTPRAAEKFPGLARKLVASVR